MVPSVEDSEFVFWLSPVLFAVFILSRILSKYLTSTTYSCKNDSKLLSLDSNNLFCSAKEREFIWWPLVLWSSENGTIGREFLSFFCVKRENPQQYDCTTPHGCKVFAPVKIKRYDLI